jgi:two-component system, OmpR family, clock-associated histidine kinase SasA
MSVSSPLSSSSGSIQFLLFVDERSRHTPPCQAVVAYLTDDSLPAIDLRIIDVSEHPDLAEYFKLVTTPTLVKLCPTPRQSFSGSQIVAELKHWLPNWLDEVAVEVSSPDHPGANVDFVELNFTHLSQFLRLEDEVFHLRRQQSEMREQLRFKEQVINILAHDLRNPLTAVSLALDTLGIAQNSEDRRNAHLQSELAPKLLLSAKNQLQRADRLINDMLQLSQGAGAEMQLNPRSYQLADLLQDVLRQLGEQFRRKQQQVITDIPQDLPPVYIDDHRIQQVLVNLLENASKYTPQQSQIRIAAFHRTSQKVQVSIMDNGLGIPESDFDLVFEKNYRVTSGEQAQGYGLGLPLCKTIILAHYGQIWVESSGKGAVFHFTLPIYS